MISEKQAHCLENTDLKFATFATYFVHSTLASTADILVLLESRNKA